MVVTLFPTFELYQNVYLQQNFQNNSLRFYAPLLTIMPPMAKLLPLLPFFMEEVMGTINELSSSCEWNCCRTANECHTGLSRGAYLGEQDLD